MFKKIFIILSLALSLATPSLAFAQTAESSDETPAYTETLDTFYKAKVISILEEGQKNVDGVMQDHQKLELEIKNGNEVGKRIIIDHGGSFAIQSFQKVSVGETVVVVKPTDTGMGAKQDYYYIVDKYRINNILILVAIFFVLALYFGRKRGLTSIIGLLFSILIIFYFVIPNIVRGGDPFLYAIIGSFAILFVSLYLSHGFNRRTTIALVSTIGALCLAVGIDWAFVHFAKLAGNGTEEAFFLQFGSTSINLQGLLLAGIIIGVLGVLDDVTTSQSAAIEEIHHANPSLNYKELYRRGISIGREHIASLINTLVLAYAGASFPLLLLYTTQKSLPLWVTLNGNFIGEEIVRTLVGSSVLVIAVPLTTFLAAFYCSLQTDTSKDIHT